MPGKHYDLDNDVLLGGEKSSEIYIASQKAVKTYIDKQIEDVTAGATTELASLQDVNVDGAKADDILAYNGTEWENKQLVIPSKTSDLENDSNFLTEVPSEYITETELTQKNYITLNDIQDTLNSKANTDDLADVATSGSYNDLTDLPTIPGQYTLPTASTTELGGVKIDGDTITITDGVIKAKQVDISDLATEEALQQAVSGKADKSEIPTKVSDLENDSNFISSVPDYYITEEELEANLTAKGYALKTELPTVPTKVSAFENDAEYVTETGLAGKGFLTEVPAEYITETELQEKGYLTEHQSLADYAKTSYVDTELEKKADAQALTSGLAGKADKTTVTELESTLNSQIAAKADKETVTTELAKKADKETVTTALTELETEVAGKVDTTTYTTDMALKANMADVTTELNKKANVDDVYTKSETYTQEEVNNLVNAINAFNISIVQDLPTENIDTHTIYFVSKTGSTNDVYDEYLYVNNTWELVGSTQVDLTPYLKSADAETIYAKKEDLQSVATSGSYNDLADTPEIPVVKETYDATSTDAVSGQAVAEAIANKVVTFKAW